MFFKNQAKLNLLISRSSAPLMVSDPEGIVSNPCAKFGFMMVEVIIAVTLLGIGSIAIMNLQTNTLGRVRQAQVHMAHLFKLQNLFFEPELQKNMLEDGSQMRAFEPQDIQDFKTFKYEIVPVASKSELSRFADLHLMQSSGSWAGFNRDYEDTLIGLVYIAPKQLDNQAEQVVSSELDQTTPALDAKAGGAKKPVENPKQEKAAT